MVTVTLENNQLYETENLNFSVSCVNRCERVDRSDLLRGAEAHGRPRHISPCCSPTGACPCPCDYTQDPTCTCRDLQQSILVSATKSAVFATYPVAYTQQFNGHPTEVGTRALPAHPTHTGL